MRKKAIVVGNSDGIGLEVTKQLLKDEWSIIGISRSELNLPDENYQHFTVSVELSRYQDILRELITTHSDIELVIFCPGIGELIDLSDMSYETAVFEVNLIGMVKTTQIIIPYFVNKQKGHFIGLSSLADQMLSEEAPSYHASKAAFSNYLESLALACIKKGVHVTNLRFGFVDTKMAKADVKPFMMSVGKAANHITRCIRKKPARYTAPKIAIPLVKLIRFLLNIKVLSQSL